MSNKRSLFAPRSVGPHGVLPLPQSTLLALDSMGVLQIDELIWSRAMPFDLIFERVSAIRPVTQSSLILNLDFHPRFYQSTQNSFGLRGWLAQGEMEDLPTHDWLREDPTSLTGVERAKARGRHVEKIIAEDRLCPQGQASES